MREVDIPRQALLVFGIDLASFLKFGNELLDVLLVVIGVEVDDDHVDHFELKDRSCLVELVAWSNAQWVVESKCESGSG